MRLKSDKAFILHLSPEPPDNSIYVFTPYWEYEQSETRSPTKLVNIERVDSCRDLR